MTECYFDNNASTVCLESVAESVRLALTNGYGNPSSAHARGALARQALRNAREMIARFLYCEPEQIIFTSGATESNNSLLKNAAKSTAEPVIASCAVEHPSVKRMLEVFEAAGMAKVVWLPVDSNGLIPMRILESALSERPTLLSLQWVNNETGVIQPIGLISELCKRYQVPLHVDAAQAVGRIPIALNELNIEFLTFSGHKLHAPMGVGVTYVRSPRGLSPDIWGGDQEFGLRAGTENFPAIAGLATACEERGKTLSESIAYMASLRDQFEGRLLREFDSVQINGMDAPRICNTSNFRFEGVDGQALMAQLDRAGVRCSQTSACSSNRPEPSRVLRAMGLTEDEAFASLRFSFSVLNTRAEIDKAIDILKQAVSRLRALQTW